MVDAVRGDLEQERRLQRIEDQLAIISMIARYGIAADCMNMRAITEIWPADGSYEVADWGDFIGHDGLRRLFGGDFQQKLMQAGSAHVASPPLIALDGDQAQAANYGMILQSGDEDVSIARLTAARWNMERREGRWATRVRRNEPVNGGDGARDPLADSARGSK
jgi:hypothetical protein